MSQHKRKKRKKGRMLPGAIIGIFILIPVLVFLVLFIREKPADNYKDDLAVTNTNIIAIATLTNTDNRDYDKVLGIEEYEYPSEFIMGDNLKAAVTQLALTYDNFDKDFAGSEEWKETFIARFIQNSRLSFDYLEMVSEKNNGQIFVDELNYIQYSLTGMELDVSSYTGGAVDRYDAAGPLNYGSVSDYDYAYTDNGVIVTADFEIGYDGTDSVEKREITVELHKNPYSCFDGYSVAALSSKMVTSSLGPDSSTPMSDETGRMDENNGAKEDALENLAGEYTYLSDYGNGRLMIKRTSDGYDIFDYESEFSYRFLADASNIEAIENNRIYIKYPEQVFSDDTVSFCYYILEYGTDEIDVYYRKSAFGEAEFLYHAERK
jgi:hypothetical protein